MSRADRSGKRPPTPPPPPSSRPPRRSTSPPRRLGQPSQPSQPSPLGRWRTRRLPTSTVSAKTAGSSIGSRRWCGNFDIILKPFPICFSAACNPPHTRRATCSTQQQHGHNTATAQPQHSHSTATAQPLPCHPTHAVRHALHSNSTATIRPQHSHSTATAQPQHSHRHVTPHAPCDMLYLVLSAHTWLMLIGACDPMLCPIAIQMGGCYAWLLWVVADWCVRSDAML